MKALTATIIVLLIVTTSGYAYAVYTFQQGVNGYTGTVDTYLGQIQPDIPVPEYPWEIVVDTGLYEHGLIRFDGIFGSTPSQIPIGTTPEDIVEAKLFLHQSVITGDVEVHVHRMLGLWYDTDTWNIWGNGNLPHNSQGGIQADGIEAVLPPDYIVPATDQSETLIIDVTKSVRAWLEGSTNYGWVLLPGENSNAGRRFKGSEWTDITLRPRLEITIIPEPATLLLFGLGGLLFRRQRTEDRRQRS